MSFLFATPSSKSCTSCSYVCNAAEYSLAFFFHSWWDFFSISRANLAFVALPSALATFLLTRSSLKTKNVAPKATTIKYNRCQAVHATGDADIIEGTDSALENGAQGSQGLQGAQPASGHPDMIGQAAFELRSGAQGGQGVQVCVGSAQASECSIKAARGAVASVGKHLRCVTTCFTTVEIDVTLFVTAS